MTSSPDRIGRPPRHQALLDGTDWPSLATACGTGESLPAALARFLDPDPAVRAAAVTAALGEVTHQNSIYEATVPVALFVATVLDHPAVTANEPPHCPTLVRLLDWLADTAYDADDECLAINERCCGDQPPDADVQMRAFRDQRPVLHSAVRSFLGHHDAGVRDAALVAAIPLVEHPELATHRGELGGHARRLLATSTDRRHRDRVLDAMKAWGHDIDALEDASDVEARERYARLRAARESWAGGYSEAPAF